MVHFIAFIHTNKHVKLLLEYCVSEMEAIYGHGSLLVSPPSKHTVQESSHPYQDESYLSGYVSIPGIKFVNLFIFFLYIYHHNLLFRFSKALAT